MTTRPDQLLEVIKPCSEIHVIPALAGFNLLNPLVSGDKYDIVGVCRQPIVAWRIETEALDEAGIRNVRFRSFCYPITSDHSINADSPTNWAIEYPPRELQCSLRLYLRERGGSLGLLAG
jgi:hypothetical protein